MDNMRENLWDALEKRNWPEFEKLILSGADDDRDYYDYDDWPMIFLLIEAGQEDLAILWLDHDYPYWMPGGKISAGIHHWASKFGMPRLLEKCIEKGLDINEVTQDDHSPLWYAADNGHLECAKLLLAHGADFDGLEPDEREKQEEWIPRKDTPLCASANFDMAKLLLESGASLELGPYGEEFVWGEEARIFRMGEEILTPLTCAAIRGRMDVARLLADRGVALDSQALRYIALGANYGKATLKDAAELIRMGADVNGEPGLEPLAVAARAGNTVFCRFLLDMGAKPIPDALNLAILSKNQECVDLFLEAGDPASAIRLAAERGAGSILAKLLHFRPNLMGYALLGAIAGCRLGLAREMLEQGALANFCDKNGNTPLIALYAIDRRKGAFKFMMNNPSRYPSEWQYNTPKRLRDIDFNRNDFFHYFIHQPDNWNEIMERIEDDVIELARELIGIGADIHTKDNKGRNALWHACSMSWLKSIPWLAGMGLDMNERDKNGNSAFDAGCLCGDSLTIEPMVRAGAAIDAQDSNGDTVLLKCGRRWIENSPGYALSAASWLLDLGADPDLENNAGVSLRKMAGKDENLQWAIERAESEK